MGKDSHKSILIIQSYSKWIHTGHQQLKQYGLHRQVRYLISTIYEFILDNDEYKTQPGFLGFTTPNLFQMLSTPQKQATFQDIFPTDGNNYLNYRLKVQNGDGTKIIGDEWKNYYMRFSQAQTPHIVDVVPNIVYAGQEIQFLTIVNWANSNSRTAGRKPVEEIKIGNYNTDMDLITEDSDIDNQYFATPFTVRLGEDIKPSKSE